MFHPFPLDESRQNEKSGPMREYRQIPAPNTQGVEEDEVLNELKDGGFIYLVPVGENPPSHVIRFRSAKEAHQYRLALGLGTHPSPDKDPLAYQAIAENYQGAAIFEVLKEREPQEDEFDSGCCQSGCPGCPWTEEQIRLGKL